MVALQIRDVPDDTRRTLAELAARRGQSLQSFLLTLVTGEARRAENAAIVARFANRRDGSSLSAAQAAEVIDTARAERNSR